MAKQYNTQRSKKEERIVNGYRLIYKPDFYLSYKEGNHKGYVYEHKYVVAMTLKRRLHHLNLVRKYYCLF